MKCDKCNANTNARYQLGSQWVCWPCLPKEVLKRYPLADKQERKAHKANNVSRTVGATND